MNANQKHDRARRHRIAKLANRERERLAREHATAAENPPHADLESQAIPESSENFSSTKPDAEGPETSLEAPQETERTQDEVLQLSSALEEEKRVRQSERIEKDALKKKLQEAEQEMNRLTRTIDREKRETERLRLHYEGRVKELEQRVAATLAARRASPSSEESEQQDLSSSKATFRIDLYPHQGQFQGKIEHMLTHDKRAFSGVDQAAISAFIAAHLPPLESKADELQKILTLHADQESKPETQPVTPAAPAQSSSSKPEQGHLAPSLPGMHLVLGGRRSRTNMLRYDQSFDVELDVAFTERSEAESAPWECDVALFAKRIEGGPRQNIAKTAHRLAALGNASPLRVQGVRLAPQGTYRLEALVNVKSSAVPGNVYALRTHKLIQIY